MDYKDFKISSLQISVFTPEILFAKSKVLEKMMNEFSELFDGEVVSVPIPPDAPKEIPRMILYSDDRKLKLEIAESRINFFRYRTEDTEKIDLNKSVNRGFKILKKYKNFTEAIFGRLAVVIVKFLRNENPASVLAQQFCKDRWTKEIFDNPNNFEIHSHKKYTLKEFNINSWVRCKSGIITKDKNPIVLVTQDINTLAEELERKNFSIEQFEEFIKVVIKEQGQILIKYFPKG